MVHQNLYEKHEVRSADGTKLHAIFRPASTTQDAEPKTILWVHGAFEHSGRYQHIMDHFAQLGYASITMDLRGHGLSGGTRMYIKTVDDYLQDVKATHDHFAPHLRGKLYMVAHSMGGLVALRFRQAMPDAMPLLACTVLASPFLGVAAPIPGWKKAASKIMVSIAPKFSMPNELDSAFISHDPAQVKAYANDPLVYKKATTGWFEAILKALVQAKVDAPRTPGPLHIIASGDDRFVDLNATKAVYAALPASIEKSLYIFEGAYHELFNEAEKEAAYLKVEDILSKY